MLIEEALCKASALVWLTQMIFVIKTKGFTFPKKQDMCFESFQKKMRNENISCFDIHHAGVDVAVFVLRPNIGETPNSLISILQGIRNTVTPLLTEDPPDKVTKKYLRSLLSRVPLPDVPFVGPSSFPTKEERKRVKQFKYMYMHLEPSVTNAVDAVQEAMADLPEKPPDPIQIYNRTQSTTVNEVLINQHKPRIEEDITCLMDLVAEVPSPFNLALDIDSLCNEINGRPSFEPEPPDLPCHYDKGDVVQYPRIYEQMHVIPLASDTFQVPPMEIEKLGYNNYTLTPNPVSIYGYQTGHCYGYFN